MIKVRIIFAQFLEKNSINVLRENIPCRLAYPKLTVQDFLKLLISYPSNAKEKQEVVEPLAELMGEFFLDNFNKQVKVFDCENNLIRFKNEFGFEPYQVLAKKFEIKGNLKEARKNYLIALANDKFSYISCIGLAGIYIRQKNYPMAILFYKMALNIRPSQFVPMRELSRLYMKVGNQQKALWWLMRAKKRSPHNKFILEIESELRSKL